MRMCVGCKEMKNKRDLVRIVKTPQDELVLDDTGKLSGRGAYICRDVACLQKAVKSKGLERSFKMKISDDIFAQLSVKIGDNGGN